MLVFKVCKRHAEGGEEMKTEEEIKEAMENIKMQLTRSSGEGTILLQGQYSSLDWVLDEEKKKDE